MIGVSDPVGNELELRDLKPYTRYHLDLRSRFGNKENWGSIDFSTASKQSSFNYIILDILFDVTVQRLETFIMLSNHTILHIIGVYIMIKF